MIDTAEKAVAAGLRALPAVRGKATRAHCEHGGGGGMLDVPAAQGSVTVAVERLDDLDLPPEGAQNLVLVPARWH